MMLVIAALNVGVAVLIFHNPDAYGFLGAGLLLAYAFDAIAGDYV